MDIILIHLFLLLHVLTVALATEACEDESENGNSEKKSFHKVAS